MSEKNGVGFAIKQPTLVEKLMMMILS